MRVWRNLVKRRRGRIVIEREREREGTRERGGKERESCMIDGINFLLSVAGKTDSPSFGIQRDVPAFVPAV